MRDIIDIKEVFFIFSPVQLIAIIILISIALLLILFFLFKKIRKKTYKKLSPQKIFFNSLASLHKENADIKKKCFGLLYIFKTYLENRFQIQARERTTQELKIEMQVPEIPQAWKNKIFSGFKKYDEILYSGKPLSKEEIAEFESLAVSFVNETTTVK